MIYLQKICKTGLHNYRTLRSLHKVVSRLSSWSEADVGAGSGSAAGRTTASTVATRKVKGVENFITVCQGYYTKEM